MATEYKLPYTASDINNRLRKIDDLALRNELPTTLADLEDDTTHRLVTDTEKSTWNSKANISDIPTKVSELTNDAGYLTNFTESDPTVPAWAKASTKPSYTKSEVGLSNVDNVKQYSTSNPPPYPVTKVNNKTGAVTLSASDVGALPNTTKIPTKVSDLTNDSGYITSVPDEIYVGNGEMPETATIQILMDGSDEEQALMDELKEYIDGELGKLSQKVDKNQGSANVGKILVVGADGNFTLTDMPVGGVTGDVIGMINSDNNIVITGGLADGTYVFKYENTNGTYSNIGTLVVGGVVEYSIDSVLTNCTGASGNAKVIRENGNVTLQFTANNGYVFTENITVSGAMYTWDNTTGILVLENPTADVTVNITAIVYTSYTNVLPLAQEYASTSPYVGTDGSVGYGNHMRISSSSSATTYMKALTGVDTTALIPVKRGDILRFKNCNVKVTPSNTSYGTNLMGFNSSKAVVAGFGSLYNNIQNRLPCVVQGDEIVQITLEPLAAWTTSDIDNVAYIMIATDGLDETSIITINQEITA